jgi:hypothetical protein
MEKQPKIIAVSEKIYGNLLRLYPQSHRRDYAEQMSQLFRDQCRDAYGKGRSAGLMKLWLRVLPDIGKTSLIEQITAIERNQIMKYINAKNSPMVLMVIGLVLGGLSFYFLDSSGTWRLLATASFIFIFAKALVELFRPSSEYGRILLRTLLVMFCFSLFMPTCMPAWAKARAGLSVVPASLGSFLYIWFFCLMANPLVAALKLLQHFIQRRKTKRLHALA